ncbi:putative protein-synthesizing GTPase [Medicago truncatula]|nr:putative protein-synthesizing GTPase [Medicago truncatula]
MDTTMPKDRYIEIVGKLLPFLKKVGYNPDKTRFVPISGFNGDNLIERSTNIDWYNSPTLLEALLTDSTSLRGLKLLTESTTHQMGA